MSNVFVMSNRRSVAEAIVKREQKQSLESTAIVEREQKAIVKREQKQSLESYSSCQDQEQSSERSRSKRQVCSS